MSVAKILGIETEYAVQAAGPGPGPDRRVERARQRVRRVGLPAHRVGLRRREPRARRAGHADDLRHGADGRDAPRQHRAHQRRALLRRPRAPRVLLAGVRDAERGRPLRRRRRARPARGDARGARARARSGARSSSTRTTRTARATRTAATRTSSSTARCPSATWCARWCRTSSRRIVYAGSGKVGAETGAARSQGRGVPALPARRVHRGGRRSRDDAQAPDRQHPRRAARRPAALPAAPHHRRRREHVPGRDVPQARHDGAAPRRARGPRASRGSPSRPPTRCARSTSCPATSTSPASSSSPAAGAAARSTSSRQLYELAERYVAGGGAECVGGDDEARAILDAVVRGARRAARRDPEDLADDASTGSPSAGSSRATARATTLDAGDPRLHALDLQYHDLRPERSLALRAGLEVLVDARRRPARGDRATT